MLLAVESYSYLLLTAPPNGWLFIYEAHPTDRTKFLIRFNDGEFIVWKCPSGTYWNNSLRICAISWPCALQPNTPSSETVPPVSFVTTSIVPTASTAASVPKPTTPAIMINQPTTAASEVLNETEGTDDVYTTENDLYV